ncbi:polysaccharide deacetylase family protein [Phaeobacter porticola]|uniref:Putative glycosyl transferase n=1 Tax=Phaeobacter porticola TaxID=1844006 RepID=A0A1L3I896_9RHOB|nr:polysaccharide deacetylase family protein [Phaeobacter porticola]APG48296.1 putative glycosyl transferase [Phaeobacter porticola]
MTPDWTALDKELARWQDEGLILPVWWRDDDAIAPTAHLDRLTNLSERLALPAHLAIVARDATHELAKQVTATDTLVPVVHGWAHQNHAPAQEKKTEFGSHRPIDDVLVDAENGLSRMREMFGDDLRPMFVPPWNRIAPELEPWLAGIGFTALSTFTPRQRAKAAPGLWQINTHLDPIDWRGARALVPPTLLLSQVVTQLAARRKGNADVAEPYGILTHHLVQDDATWGFCEDLMRRLLDGPGRAWVFDERII